MEKTSNSRKTPKVLIKIILTVLVLLASYPVGIIPYTIVRFCTPVHYVFWYLTFVFFPALILPLIWCFTKKRKVLICWSIFVTLFIACGFANYAHLKHIQNIRIYDTSSISEYDYLPFDEDSKVATLDHEASLKFDIDDDLPVLDGTHNLLPVYSAFANAVYPDLESEQDAKHIVSIAVVNDNYNSLIAEHTDIYFGTSIPADVIPRIDAHGSDLVFTQIGTEALVFFVHENNQIDNLASEEIRSIYAGSITNWNELGGSNRRIIAYQRGFNSNSHNTLVYFMGETPVMEAPMEEHYHGQVGIWEETAVYKNTKNAIGYSLLGSVADKIDSKNLKLLSVDDVYPTQENIANGTYPITTPIYAVTYEGNDNPNVQLLLDWILSAEGQELLEKSGYAGI